MSHGENTGQPRPANKPGLFPLMIMAFMAFYLFSQYQQGSGLPGGIQGARPQAERLPGGSQIPGGSATPGSSPAPIPEIVIPDISNDGPGGGPGGGNTSPPLIPEWAKPRQPASDWAIDTDIPTTAASQSEPVQSGDWSLEIGDSTEADGNRQLQKKSPQSKSTTKGDWEISEVDP